MYYLSYFIKRYRQWKVVVYLFFDSFFYLHFRWGFLENRARKRYRSVVAEIFRTLFTSASNNRMALIKSPSLSFFSPSSKGLGWSNSGLSSSNVYSWERKEEIETIWAQTGVNPWWVNWIWSGSLIFRVEVRRVCVWVCVFCLEAGPSL